MSFGELFFILLIFIPLIMLWIFALVDLFRRKDLDGWVKALWAIAILVFPILGMLIYFITRKPTAEEEEAARSYYREMAGADVPEQLEKLADLHDKGVLTDEEFAEQKAKLLGT
jgi:hypothetical protein